MAAFQTASVKQVQLLAFSNGSIICIDPARNGSANRRKGKRRPQAPKKKLLQAEKTRQSCMATYLGEGKLISNLYNHTIPI
jgi:hypothetical protein